MKLQIIRITKHVIPECFYRGSKFVENGFPIKVTASGGIPSVGGTFGNDIKIWICLGAVFLTTDVFACSACFKGDPGQTANVAARAGVLLLLAVIVSVLGVFALFFVNVAKRSKQFI